MLYGLIIAGGTGIMLYGLIVAIGSIIIFSLY